MAEQIIRVLRDELSWRDTLAQLGVREICTTTTGSKLQNRFDIIDEDVRILSHFWSNFLRFVSTMTVECVQLVANIACFLLLGVSVIISGFIFLDSSIDSIRVSCMKDYNRFCKCPPTKKFLMSEDNYHFFFTIIS